MQIRTKNLKTDVLIIGSGGAGLRAAIGASNAGVNVLVVSKGEFPSGCTTVSMGGMLAAFDPQDSADQHFQDTLEGGSYLNDPELVRLLVDGACERTIDLERYGTNFDKDGNEYKLFPCPESSVAREVWTDDPYQGGYIRGLVQEAKYLGINFLPHVMIIDLVKDNNVVVGAIGLEFDADHVLAISTKATILATGGAGELYRLTTNPPGITGDGYTLGFNAGAKLGDMEFVQGRACMILPEGMRGIPPPADGLVMLGGRFYNILCERFMKRYHPEKLEMVTRAQMSICVQKEIQSGRGTPEGGVYGDLSGVARGDLAKFKKFMESCAAEGFDPTWQPYQWAPGVHHFMGGILINTKCETGVPGLYAAGETAMGVHGANRLSGNALTETQVFGAIAGAEAATWACSRTNRGVLSAEQIKSIVDWIESVYAREGGYDPMKVKAELAETMSVHVGVLRNEEGLQKAVQVIDTIKKDKLRSLVITTARSFRALALLKEVENLVIVAELVATAAKLRTETRGAHNREDYPESDRRWERNIRFRKRKKDDLAIDIRPVKNRQTQ